MHNFIVFSDYNLFGENPLQEDFVYGDNVIFAGNIVALDECKLNKIDEALLKINELRSLAGTNYIAGEGEKYIFNIMIKKKNILFMNSDSHIWKPQDALMQGAFYLNELKCDTLVMCNPLIETIKNETHQGFRFITIPKGRTSLSL